MPISMLMTLIQGVRTETRGATAIEYGLIAAGIAVAIAAAVFALGGDLAGVFESVSDTIAPADATVTTPATN